MKRKLCCAVALVGDPHVVLLDEPSAGLDPVSQRNLWNLIKSTMTGRAVLLTTHSMLEADALCDRVGIQVRGQFHCVGSPQHLKDRYASGYELVAYLETADHEPALGAYLQSKLEAAGCGCALAGLAAGVATYELQGERPLKHAFACLEDTDARARLGVRSFRVDRASMEKVFIRIVGEGRRINQTQRLLDGVAVWVSRTTSESSGTRLTG
jgi:ABC-type multidrug transport system ATPase subunit